MYGARADRYPGWNPYIYGRPDPEPKAKESDSHQDNRANWPMPMAGQPGPGRSGNPGNPQARPGVPGWPPQGMPDLNDPSQNPAYGHWDPCAIIAFLMALFLPMPVIPALLGGVSMYRTRRLHMKGYGLAMAALIINLLFTLAWIWLLINGISLNDFYQQMIPSPSTGGGGSGSDGVSA
ncbi:hypothetical protein DKK75_04825 [Bifidobacterium asteroides]|uniref:DUF4190 domain-containing protein n=1 Tax=Bifidobacterium asteroides TaxID=1684 RepID=A0A318M2C2_9BIFI|nr:hypothetical protein DKK75_04825 [Bifidobacterium asteroides]